MKQGVTLIYKHKKYKSKSHIFPEVSVLFWCFFAANPGPRWNSLYPLWIQDDRSHLLQRRRKLEPFKGTFQIHREPLFVSKEGVLLQHIFFFPITLSSQKTAEKHEWMYWCLNLWKFFSILAHCDLFGPLKYKFLVFLTQVIAFHITASPGTP